MRVISGTEAAGASRAVRAGCLRGWWRAAAALLLWTGGPAVAAVFSTIDFSAGLDGWTHQSGGPMTLSHADGMGLPAGALQGTFADQGGVPSTETDSFRATAAASGGALTGNYWLQVPGFTSWTFNFYADDVVPSDCIVRFGNGVNTFMRNVLPQVSAQDSWQTVSVSLSYAGWLGGSAATFSNVLSNVTFVEVQFSRNGSTAQDFYLDNFALNGPGSGGGSGNIPEPGSGLLVLAGAGLLTGWRGRRARERTGSAPLR